MTNSILKNHDGIQILVEWTKILNAHPIGGMDWKAKAHGEGEDGSEWECECEGSFVGSIFVISKTFSHNILSNAEGL
jgi:hypothetical protein